MALAEVQYRQLLDKIVVNHDPGANRIVRTVGQRLAKVAAKTNYLWEFVIIDAPESVGDWLLPGGKVGVCTGLFPVHWIIAFKKVCRNSCQRNSRHKEGV